MALVVQASALTLKLDKTQYPSPATVVASWTAGTGNGADWIGIYPAGVTPGSQASTAWKYINGTTTASSRGPKNGSVTFSNLGLTPGSYVAYYLANGGFTILAGPIGFTVANASPTLLPGKAEYDNGETITFNFSGGPGNPSDWIGVYSPGQVPGSSTPATLWCYTNGTTTAGGGATSGSVSFTNPGLGSGTYIAYFLANNGYGILSGPVSFGVRNAAPKWLLPVAGLRHAVAGTTYSAKIDAYAMDPDSQDTLAFGKASGPSWLAVSAAGMMSGTPTGADVGTHDVVVTATDSAGNSAQGTFRIQVFLAGTESVTSLKVMSFNLWHGFGSINNGHRKGLDAVILSGADLIGTQETVDNVSGSNVYQVRKLAEDLGWYYSPAGAGDSGILSRYPIVSQFVSGVANGVRVRLCANPVRDVILYNCHLDYLHYAPYAAQLNGATASKVLTEEMSSQRDEEIAVILSGMSGNLANADTTPVFLTGDFNAPSHLDWTNATASAHGGVGYVAFPASIACGNAGLVDSYRAIYPNPSTHPGNTWSPVYVAGEPQDRIDFIYHKGSGASPVVTGTYTTGVEATLGAWGADTTPAKNNTWPSDHAAVITEFQLD